MENKKLTAMEKMTSERLYACVDEEMARKQTECLELQYDYNATRPSESKKRQELMTKMFAELGEGCYIEPPRIHHDRTERNDCHSRSSHSSGVS